MSYLCTMKAIIYENEGKFDVHNENGNLIKSGFNSEQEAVYFCKQNNLLLVDMFLVI